MSSILVLDDRPAERDLLVTVLGYVGHAVAEAATGPEALAIARATLPDLVIVDLNMPGMNGYEFVRQLRADPAVGATRVLFCTATYDEEEARGLADALGVSDILIKPCEPERIIQIVGDVLMREGTDAPSSVAAEFDREQLRVLNAKLVQKNGALEKLTRDHAESLMLLDTLQATAPIGFGFLDRQFRFVRMNQTLASISGIPAERQLGRAVADLAPDIWPQLEPIYRRVLDTGEPVLNDEVRRQDPATPGAVRYWLNSYYPVRLEDVVVGIGVISVDITDRRQAEDFRAVVMQNMAEGLIVTDDEGRVMFMNAAASRMTGWSEDELRGKSMHTAIHYQYSDGSPFPEHRCPLLAVGKEGQTVRVAEDAFTHKNGTIFPVACSAAPLLTDTTVRGIVQVFRDTTDEQGERARVRRELDTLTWVGRIRDAIDDDRLVLYTQPIIALAATAEPSEELLIRMIGPDGKAIPPGSFIPVAEKYGLIGEIDRWVIRQAIHRAAAGHHIHANLSADSIGNPDLFYEIEQDLADTGADPANLVFEVTETALMRDLDAGEEFARRIGRLGCGVALDDFGTGYGSFTYLQRLNIRCLKVDIAFIRELVTNTTNQHLVKAIVNIAEGLGQQTVAEGVENAETLELLRGFGIDLAQGFHIGRPAPMQWP
jgi:PAS domain S-box-containing protein